MAQVHRIPISNRGPSSFDIGLEPEGDCIPLGPGERLEIRYSPERKSEHTIELEIEGNLLSIHCMATKEIWRDGQRVR